MFPYSGLNEPVQLFFCLACVLGFRLAFNHFEFLFHCSGWFFPDQGEDHDRHTGKDECRQQFIDAEYAADWLDQKFPDENSDSACQHASDGTLTRCFFPEQGEQHQRSECRPEARPGEGYDREDDGVLIQSDDDA